MTSPLTPAERQRKRRAALRAKGLSSVVRPLGKRRKKWAVTDAEVMEVIRVSGITAAQIETAKREASEHLIKRTSNWRVTKITE